MLTTENEKYLFTGTFLTKLIDLLLQKVLIFSLNVVHNCRLNFLLCHFYALTKKVL